MSRAGDQSFWGVGVPAIYNTLSHEPIGKGHNVVAAFMGDGKKRAGGGMGWWWHTPDDTIDKIDPELLVRDTRVYLQTLWRLLTDTVLPIDHREQVAELKALVDELSSDVAGRFDLSGLRTSVEQLFERTGRLHEAAMRIGKDGTPAQVQAVNRTLVALSRLLTPLEYTNGDRFIHDPALGQNAFPSLDGIRRLRATAARSDDEKFAAVAARQGRNRIHHTIEKAIHLLDEALPTL
jgi:hypothetical protein